jgi:tRNA(Glu) U13 pseudouridine synthase TruD
MEAIVSQLMREEGITQSVLEMSVWKGKLPGTFRAAAVTPGDLCTRLAPADDAEGTIEPIVGFSLPRGSYATVVLRELLKSPHVAVEDETD